MPRSALLMAALLVSGLASTGCDLGVLVADRGGDRRESTSDSTSSGETGSTSDSSDSSEDDADDDDADDEAGWDEEDD